MAGSNFNLVNPDDVDTYLKKFCNHNAHYERLLIIALSRILKKAPSCISTLEALPDDAPQWLKDKWFSQPVWHKFVPKQDIRLAYKISQIFDCVAFSIQHEADWLKNVDSLGRPYKLLKINDLDKLLDEMNDDRKKIIADIRRKARATYQTDATEDTVTILNFNSGFKFVRLLTPQALDRESAYLEHCIGDGGYDGFLKEGGLAFYSLRNPENLPCATISVDIEEETIHQISGKRNSFPHEYYDYLATFNVEFRLNLSGYMCINPDKYSVENHHEFGLFESLKHKTEVLKRLDFEDPDTEIELPDDTKARSLYISQIGNLKKFPKNLYIEKSAFFYGKGFPAKPPEI